jgi:hypothetical protein
MWSGVKIKNFRGKGANFVSKSYQESGAKGAVQVRCDYPLLASLRSLFKPLNHRLYIKGIKLSTPKIAHITHHCLILARTVRISPFAQDVILF